MFIATGLHPRFRSFRSEIRQRNIGDEGKGGFAPAERGAKKRDRTAINISPLWGEESTMFGCTSKLNRECQMTWKCS
jgi:hypothetical protein